jgi:cell wall assembly regulator SMI1
MADETSFHYRQPRMPKKRFEPSTSVSKHTPAAGHAPLAESDGEGSLARLSTIWREKRPSFEKSLRPGARAPALAKLAKSLGVTLPPGFLAFYTWHDGAKDEHEPFEGKYGWFSLAGILEHKKMLDSHPEPEVHASWSSAWIPFLQENYSDLVCLDTRSGVVFERSNCEPQLLLLAPSFDAWLAAHVAISQAARSLAEDDLYDAFDSASAMRIRAKISPGFPKRTPAKSLLAR